jgi:hypothetical protein
MRRIPLIPRIAAVVAVIAGAALAFALPAGADVSILSPPVAAVQVGSPATLVARGAAVSVPVTVVCAPGGTGFLFIQVAERVGGSTARGGESTTTPPCTGAFQTINVVVTSQGEPFRKGVAFASADFTVCDFSGCLSATDQREIQIVR